MVKEAILAVKEEIMRSIEVLPQVDDRRKMVFKLMVQLSVTT